MKILSSDPQAHTAVSKTVDEGCFQVAVGAIIEDSTTGKILLLQRPSQDELDPNGFEFVYGRLKQGEEVDAGLLREIKEETGLTRIKTLTQVSYWHIYRGEKRKENEVIGLTFWCQTDHSKEILLSGEHQAFRWVEPKDVSGLLRLEGVKNDWQNCYAWQQKQLDIQTASAREQRSLADYQNLLRRVTQEKTILLDQLGFQAVKPLLMPLEHLSLATEQIKDQGLKMVAEEFKQALAELGLQEFRPLGETFSAQTMEAIKRQGKGEKVLEVTKVGFLLNGKVIQPAQVIVG